jgi:hypothetical protein
LTGSSCVADFIWELVFWVPDSTVAAWWWWLVPECPTGLLRPGGGVWYLSAWLDCRCLVMVSVLGRNWLHFRHTVGYHNHVCFARFWRCMASSGMCWVQFWPLERCHLAVVRVCYTFLVYRFPFSWDVCFGVSQGAELFACFYMRYLHLYLCYGCITEVCAYWLLFLLLIFIQYNGAKLITLLNFEAVTLNAVCLMCVVNTTNVWELQDLGDKKLFAASALVGQCFDDKTCVGLLRYLICFVLQRMIRHAHIWLPVTLIKQYLCVDCIVKHGNAVNSWCQNISVTFRLQLHYLIFFVIVQWILSMFLFTIYNWHSNISFWQEKVVWTVIFGW